MSATWTVIPWSILKDLTMSYRDLRDTLNRLDEDHLDQTVTLYSLQDDDFVPAIMTDYTDESTLEHLDSDHLVITF